MPFADRVEAGRRLAQALAAYVGRQDLLVLGLPRGGVPVAAEVARALDAPLDLMLVRKLGVPGHEELAMGAIASGGARVLNQDLIDDLGIPQSAIDMTMTREQEELRRRDHAYRGQRAAPAIRNRCVLVVDDGVATGATMRAALKALRQASPAELVVAVPVMPPDTAHALEADADRVICLEQPSPFFGVGYWYRDFGQTSDGEVRTLLASFWGAPPPRTSGGAGLGRRFDA